MRPALGAASLDDPTQVRAIKGCLTFPEFLEFITSSTGSNWFAFFFVAGCF